MNTKNFLIATIKVPVKINSNGEIIALDDYAEITVEPLTTEPKQTFDSVYGKIIEYIHNNPEYLTSVVDEKEPDDEHDETTTITNDTILHNFSYLKKSKKPLNISFRNKGTKHNFTKKNYD
jgi:hypothetical protein